MRSHDALLRATFAVGLGRAACGSQEKRLWVNSWNCSQRGGSACSQLGTKAVPWKAGILSVKSENYGSPSPPKWMFFFFQTTMGDMCSRPVGPVLSYHPMSRHMKTQLGLPCLALSSPCSCLSALHMCRYVFMKGLRTSKSPDPSRNQSCQPLRRQWSWS